MNSENKECMLSDSCKQYYLTENEHTVRLLYSCYRPIWKILKEYQVSYKHSYKISINFYKIKQQIISVMAYILHMPSAFSNCYPFAFLQHLSHLKKERQNLRTTTVATTVKRTLCSFTSLYQNSCWKLKRVSLDIKTPQIFFNSWTVVPYCCFIPKGSWQSGLLSPGPARYTGAAPFTNSIISTVTFHNSSLRLRGRGSLLPPNNELLLISSVPKISVNFSNCLFKYEKVAF